MSKKPANQKPAATATIVLHRRAALAKAQTPLTSEQLGTRYGAAPADLMRLRAATSAAGLSIIAEHAASRRVRVSGPADTVRAWIKHTPPALAGITLAILGGEAPQAHPRSLVARADVPGTSYTPLQLGEIYSLPAADGAGETIAIIELGGGFAQTDLDTYFRGLGLTTPEVKAVSVDGAVNTPGQDPEGADAEVLLDIEVAGALAPRANILVYFAPNTDAGFLDAISDAAHASPAPTALSISWGQSEDQWSSAARTAMDEACADAVAMGVTVIAAAGDNGSSDSGGPGPHVDFPASSPHVLGCGGTTLEAADGRVISETVWNDGGRGGATGGGVSDAFALPGWQQHAGVPARAGGGTGRGVPDVAADADPQTGYQIFVDGQAMVIGGTSAVAPFWSGLVARVAQLTDRHPGLAQTALYRGVQPHKAAADLRDITQGSNGIYSAGPGWDPCTGLGVPDAATAGAFSANLSRRS